MFSEGQRQANPDFDLPELDSLVPLSQGLFPVSIAQAFALPSLGGAFSAPGNLPCAQPQRSQRSDGQLQAPQIQPSQLPQQGQWPGAFTAQPMQHQRQQMQQPQMMQQHQTSGGSPKVSSVSTAPSYAPYPMYVPYPQGAPPPYASALPSVFGNNAFNSFGHMHGAMADYSSLSYSGRAPSSSGQPPQYGVRVGGSAAPSMTMTETTEEDLYDGTARAVKRARLVWTPQLHKRFEEAVAKLGPEKSIPKNIMQEMNVEGLTRENVASHLQKYRLQKKVSKDDLGSGGEPAADNTNNAGEADHAAEREREKASLNGSATV